MKKPSLRKRYEPFSFSKNLLVLSLVLILGLMSNVFEVAGSTPDSKETRISLNLQNVTIKELLSEIKSKSNFSFKYKKGQIDENARVTLVATSQTIDQILVEALKDQGLTYQIRDSYILIYKPAQVYGSITEGIKVTGRVIDVATNKEIPGANVVIKGTTIGTQSDVDGKYSIVVPDGKAILVISYLGYNTEEMTVGTKNTIDVFLVPDIQSLEEVVVVAFSKQKKASMVSAAETINPKELKVPSSDLTTALAGRIAGVIAVQKSGEPGADNVDFFIRGVTTFGYKKDPLIYIDGVETNKVELARLQPDDVASFSIMKDATASALYGSRGANGVILVTTKTGTAGALKISARMETSVSSNTQDIQLADPITYMQLRNEAVLTRNPSGAIEYSQEKIDNTVLGLNKYVYPSTDWRKELVKKYTVNKRFNFSANGGNTLAKYYIAGTYNTDNGILNVDERNNFNSNIKLKSYQLRSNVSINMTKTTEVTVRLSGSFDDYNGPIDGGSGLYRKIMRTSPVDFPAYYPETDLPQTKHILFGNSLFGNNTFMINPYADMVKGYRSSNKSLMNAQFEVKQDFAFITPGLSARVMFNTARYSYYDVSRGYSPYYYVADGYNRKRDTYTLTGQNETGGDGFRGTEYLGYSEGFKDVNTTTYLESAITYNKVINEKHDFTALLVYYMRQQILANQGTLQKSLPYRNLGLSGRFSYAYDSRYLAELTFGYNGSERFYKTKRYGFFPAMGLGWFVSHENFFEPLKSVVTELKFRGTYGLVGNDAIGSADDRFFYLSEMNMNNGDRRATFGENFTYLKNGISTNRYANPDITWEIAQKLNIGFDLGLFSDFQFQADYFTEHRSNILMTRADIPATLGLAADVRANLGEAKSSGWDISGTYNKSLGKDLWIQARGNFTYSHNKFVKFEEKQYTEKYKYHVGNPINQEYGYIAERLFVDDEEVKNSPKQPFGDVKGGDIKYRDVNQDGQITELDKVPLGLPTVPEIIYGFGLSVGHKGIDFSFFFQGSARSSFWIDATATSPFAQFYYPGEGGFVPQNQLLKAYADSHWSEENRNLYALWPRLNDGFNDNNRQISSWFMRNGAFLRLKSMELGYTIPTSIISKVHMKSARIYVNGTNLFLISGFKLWDVEMGGNGLGYPIQRVGNLGVLIGF